MLADERLQLSDRLVVTAEREQRVAPLLAGDEPLLFEPLAFRPRERLVEDVRQRPSAPERERLVGGREPLARIRSSAHLRQQPLEPAYVDGLVRDVEAEGAAAALEQTVASERLAHARRVHVERVRGGRRRIFAPEGIDERFARHGLVSTQEQIREHCPLLSATECRRAAFYLERSEQTELQGHAQDASTGCPKAETPLSRR